MTATQPRPAGDLASLKIDRQSHGDDQGDPAWKRVAIWAALALVFVILAAVLYRTVIAPRRAPLVETMTVRRSVMTANAALLTATGYLVADKQSAISPKLSGRVIRIGFDIGSRVRRGDVLAVLESTQVVAQRAELQASLDEASREYRRQAALWRDGVTSRALLEAAESQLAVARARLDQINVSVRDSVVVAPFDGTITVKSVEVGEVVSPLSMGQIPGSSTGGGSIATLTDLRTLEVEADVNEVNVGGLREGQPAEITVDAFPSQKWRGQLRQIVPRADRAKGVVKVKVAFRDPAERLLPDMSATVSFLGTERTESELREKPKIWIPASAIVNAGDSTRVAVLKDGRVEMRVVSRGETRENRVEIVSGLNEGEAIVSTEPGKLEDGQRVRVTKK